MARLLETARQQEVSQSENTTLRKHVSNMGPFQLQFFYEFLLGLIKSHGRLSVLSSAYLQTLH